MPSVGAYEAKTRFSELLKQVQRGEHFYITHHGVVVAVLAPLDASTGRPRNEVIEAIKAFRRGRSLGLPVRQLVEEGRL